MRWLACRLSMRANSATRRYGYSLNRDASRYRREPHSLSALAVAVALLAGRTLRCRMRARIGAYGCRGLARGRAPADSGRFCRKRAPISPWVLDFWAVSGGGRSLLAPTTWGKRRRWMAFRAGLACETAQKLRAGFACVEGGAFSRVFRSG